MQKALHPRDDVNGLYVLRKEEGRGFTRIQDSVDASIQRLEDYEKCLRRLIAAGRNNTDNTKIARTKITRKQKWEGKKRLYGHCKRQTSKILHEKTWTCLRKGNFKRETESLLIAAQNNAIRTE